MQTIRIFIASSTNYLYRCVPIGRSVRSHFEPFVILNDFIGFMGFMKNMD